MAESKKTTGKAEPKLAPQETLFLNNISYLSQVN